VDEPSPREVAAAWSAAMRSGDWEAAWRETDRIEGPRRLRQRRRGFVREPQHLRWDGTPLDGRSVLVRCEHGLGDTLQFIRFVPEVARRARDVTVLVQPHLLALLRGLPGLGAVRNGWTDEPPSPHQVEIEVMELPYALRTRIDTLPLPLQHLAHNAAGQLGFALPKDGKLNAGLLWSASDWDRSRSVPLGTLAPLVRNGNARCFSLQQGDAANDPLAQQLGIVPLSRHTTDIVAAAAAMLELDLVITVDAMAAHLAGSLRRPTWLLLKHDADWRWMDTRRHSPWYPEMRLFRQSEPGDWNSVVTAALDALQTLAADRG
jgi:hypothetical protein